MWCISHYTSIKQRKGIPILITYYATNFSTIWCPITCLAPTFTRPVAPPPTLIRTWCASLYLSRPGTFRYKYSLCPRIYYIATHSLPSFPFCTSARLYIYIYIYIYMHIYTYIHIHIYIQKNVSIGPPPQIEHSTISIPRFQSQTIAHIDILTS